MGKITILALILISFILTMVMINIYSHSKDIPDIMTDQIVNTQVQYIGNYALTYAIKQLSEGNIDLNHGINQLTYQDFNILNGNLKQFIIDYDQTNNIIEVTADISCDIQGRQKQHFSKAVLSYAPQMITGNGINNVITTTGQVNVKGGASVIGNIAQNAGISFEDIFGVTIDQARAGATNKFIDPENNFQPVTNVTYAGFENSTSTMITSSGWRGSGLLIVDGDLTITGGYFAGIIWVTGQLNMSVGNAVVRGAIFIEGAAAGDVMKISGNPDIAYDHDLVNRDFNLNNTGSDYSILAWYK